MNICSFMGRLTRDPDLKVASNDKSVVNFCIAVQNFSKDKPDATFIECIAWEKTADLIGRDFKKGSRIIISASAKKESWENKDDGEKRSKLKFIVQKFWYVDQKQSAPEKIPSGFFPEENSDDDAPF